MNLCLNSKKARSKQTSQHQKKKIARESTTIFINALGRWEAQHTQADEPIGGCNPSSHPRKIALAQSHLMGQRQKAEKADRIHPG